MNSISDHPHVTPDVCVGAALTRACVPLSSVDVIRLRWPTSSTMEPWHVKRDEHVNRKAVGSRRNVLEANSPSASLRTRAAAALVVRSGPLPG